MPLLFPQGLKPPPTLAASSDPVLIERVVANRTSSIMGGGGGGTAGLCHQEKIPILSLSSAPQSLLLGECDLLRGGEDLLML